MIASTFRLQRIEAAWTEGPIARLSGARRTGETTPAQDLGAEPTFWIISKEKGLIA